MAKAIMETSQNINLKICTNEIVQTSDATCCVFMTVPYQIKRICTKKDNDSKAIMDAHLKERASHYC